MLMKLIASSWLVLSWLVLLAPAISHHRRQNLNPASPSSARSQAASRTHIKSA